MLPCRALARGVALSPRRAACYAGCAQQALLRVAPTAAPRGRLLSALGTHSVASRCLRVAAALSQQLTTAAGPERAAEGDDATAAATPSSSEPVPTFASLGVRARMRRHGLSNPSARLLTPPLCCAGVASAAKQVSQPLVQYLATQGLTRPTLIQARRRASSNPLAAAAAGMELSCDKVR
jgi:hypothetical protein